MSADQSHSKADQPPEVPWTQPNGIYGQYDLHCHCGAIRYTMRLSPPLYKEETEGKEQCTPVSCNCSWCERNGILAVHPLAKDVEFTQGLEDRVSYYMGPKKNPHWFCRKCSSAVGTDLTWLFENVFAGNEIRTTVNARMLKDFDSDRLKIREVKFMKDVEPKYEV